MFISFTRATVTLTSLSWIGFKHLINVSFQIQCAEGQAKKDNQIYLLLHVRQSGSIPSSCSVHVEVSLANILNPKLFQMALPLVCECWCESSLMSRRHLALYPLPKNGSCYEVGRSDIYIVHLSYLHKSQTSLTVDSPKI